MGTRRGTMTAVIRFLQAHELRVKRTWAMATSTEQTETPVVKSTTEARAGETGQGVRQVLAIGTIAVIVIFGVLLFVYFH